ncbi:hypothetical protein JOC78_000572 [Bacillus ectoiniformans]|nr:hypothetical protein [Bacillus ectoiniformans]
METKEGLINELSFVEKWEKSQKQDWFWERLTRLPFKLLDRLTPKYVHEKISQLLDEIGSYIQTGGQYLTQKNYVLKKVQAHHSDRRIESIYDVASVPLATMDAVSEDLKKNRGDLATVQGATTGVGGIFTLAADIPALLGLSLKTLQEIAISYGYNPDSREERIFIIKCLQFTSSDVVGKKAILKELSSYYQGRSDQQEIMSQLQGWREVVYTYRDQFGWKKLLQMVPVAGMVFGAFTNRSMIHDIAETGRMLYRKRRILERLAEMDKTNESSI